MKTAVTHPPNTSNNSNPNNNNIVGCHHHSQLQSPNNIINPPTETVTNQNNISGSSNNNNKISLMANDDDYDDDEELISSSSSYESSAGGTVQQTCVKDNAYTTTVVAAATTTILSNLTSSPPLSSSHSSPTLHSSISINNNNNNNTNNNNDGNNHHNINNHGNDQEEEEEKEKDKENKNEIINKTANISSIPNIITTASTTFTTTGLLSQSTPALMVNTGSPSTLTGNGVGSVTIEPANLTVGSNNATPLPPSLQGLPMANELYDLFSCFRRYKPALSGKREDELTKYQSLVNQFFEKDYVISVINNKNGELCATYPPELIVIEKEKDINCKNCKEHHHHHQKQSNNPQSIQKLLNQSRFARVRTRFPFPVIFFHNKNLCRSSTLSKKIEYMFQSGVNSMKKQFSTATTPTSINNGNSPTQTEEIDNGDLQNMENLRNNDINAIKHLSVKYICDLMVENKKKKFGFYVCSSEKADMHDRYTKQFVIASTPYPGVEFFSLFNQNNHNAQDLYYAWDITEYPAELKVDNNSIPIDWDQYKSWDLLNLTQNYFKLLMEYTSDDSKDSGVLVHCISGWDRTPLFISLLRISLWADGEIHQSLSTAEILYLTVAYDWFLFSHQLYDRAGRGEDIFYFCFYFLEFITSMDYSVHSYTSLNRVNNNNNNKNNNNHNNNISPVNNNKNNSHNNSDRCNNSGIGNHRSKIQQQQPAPGSIASSLLNNRSSSSSSSSSNGKSTPTNNTLDISQSAPPTPKNNSPNSLIKLPAFIYNYTSAPPTPISHSPLPNSILGNVQSGSPNLNGMTATNAIDVPTVGSRKINNSDSGASGRGSVMGNGNGHHGSNGSNRGGYPINGSYVSGSHNEEIGGSWQLMGSLQDKFNKSLSSFGSTPKFIHPNSNSFSSSTGGESVEGEDTNSKNVSDDEDDLSDIDNTWDPSTSFIPGILDPNNDSTTSLLPDSNNNGSNNKEKKKKLKPKNNINTNNVNNDQQDNNNNNNGNHNNSNNNNNNSSKLIHNHSHHLTMKEIEERRKQRLMEVKSLFIAIYQQSCVDSTSKDSYWNTILTYLPKFG